MKRHILTLVLLAATSIIFAQEPVSRKQSQINAGVGFSTWGIPVYLGIDYGVHRNITLGAELSFRSYSDNWRNNKYHHSIIGLSGNANYHFNNVLNIPPPWDFYAGLNLGFFIWSSPNDYDGSHASGIGLGAQVGGRYYFSNRVGVNLEFGGGNAFSGGKFGITIKM